MHTYFVWHWPDLAWASFQLAHFCVQKCVNHCNSMHNKANDSFKNRNLFAYIFIYKLCYGQRRLLLIIPDCQSYFAPKSPLSQLWVHIKIFKSLITHCGIRLSQLCGWRSLWSQKDAELPWISQFFSTRNTHKICRNGSFVIKELSWQSLGITDEKSGDHQSSVVTERWWQPFYIKFFFLTGYA